MRPLKQCERRRAEAGFTFLELVAVMIILAVLTSAVVPMFHDSIVNLRKESAIENVIASMKYAHERAILNSVESRFVVDIENNQYWVVIFKELDKDNEPVFEPLSDAAGRKHTLPATLEFERPKARRLKGEDIYFVAFYPGGACDVAEVRLRDVQDRVRRSITIETEGRLGQFDVKGLD
jgi:prepilin-type N-terminal cleavage/methylation domain-containing protein